MADIEVVEVESSGQLDQFIRYPFTLYKDVPQYVFPLISERKDFFNQTRNPFYRTARVKLFLAMRDGQVCGRIATCVNFAHNDYHHEKTGFFGFFDTPDDFDIASRLLKVAMITLKKEGMEKMRGPMNFSTNHEIGFVIEGYDASPTVMMPWNFPYQVKLAEQFGLKKVMDLLAWELTRDNIPERIQKIVAKMAERSKITLRSLNLRDWDAEVERLNAVYNAAWAPNWGFVPMDKVEFTHMCSLLRQIVDPDLVLIAEFEGKPVAFSVALPDINQALIHLKGRLFPFGLLKLLWHTKIRNKLTTVRLITMGVIPEFQRRAVDMVFFVETNRRASVKGYRTGELSWTLETNELMIRAAGDMGGKLKKKYRIVEMPL